jgi:hypothetical protein
MSKFKLWNIKGASAELPRNLLQNFQLNNNWIGEQTGVCEIRCFHMWSYQRAHIASTCVWHSVKDLLYIYKIHSMHHLNTLVWTLVYSELSFHTQPKQQWNRIPCGSSYKRLLKMCQTHKQCHFHAVLVKGSFWDALIYIYALKLLKDLQIFCFFYCFLFLYVFLKFIIASLLSLLCNWREVFIYITMCMIKAFIIYNMKSL